MVDWSDLDAELDAWLTAGRTATLWWRDDDANASSAMLQRLLDLAREHHAPVALAVIPRGVQASLVDEVAEHDLVSVLVHGYAHRNYSLPGEKKAELGRHRVYYEVMDELARGREILRAIFADQLCPVLVPPWNRLDDSLIAELPAAGFTGLSALGRRSSATPVNGLVQVNVHVDVVDWRGTRGFVGQGTALRQTLAHLRARRLGEADPLEPTGLMTHHLVHDDACWDFVGELLRRTVAHPAVEWVTARRLFPRTVLRGV